MGRDARSLTMSINILTAPSLALRGRSRKKSRYIPKRLVQYVERMNDEKVAGREILEVLGVKG